MSLLLALVAALPAAALADTAARGYRPAANHLSVVVTTDQVYVTWTDPPGVQPTRVFAYRGDGSACPTGASDGERMSTPGRTNHLIDRTVKAGLSYCYSILVEDSTGTLVKVGSTGAVPVPDLKAPPPAAVPTTSPVPQPAGSGSGSGELDTPLGKAIAGTAGLLLAVSLLVVIVRLLRRSREAHPGPVWGTEIRMSFTGLSVSALIIPAVIALAWVLVVTVLVVFR
jgi:hypothetical protein